MSELRNTGLGRSDRRLEEDHTPIRVVPDEQRKTWEPRKTGYSREHYERDKAARQKRSEPTSLGQSDA